MIYKSIDCKQWERNFFKKFQSFKIYNDDEEKLIKQNIPGIAEYVTTATF